MKKLVVVQRNMPRETGVWFTAQPQALARIVEWYTEDCEIAEVSITRDTPEALKERQPIDPKDLPAIRVSDRISVRVEPKGNWPRVAAKILTPHWFPESDERHGVDTKADPSLLAFESVTHDKRAGEAPTHIAPGAQQWFDARPDEDGGIVRLTIDADLPLCVTSIRAGHDSLLVNMGRFPMGLFRKGVPFSRALFAGQCVGFHVCNPTDRFLFVREAWFDFDAAE